MTDTASTALSDEAALAEQKRKEAYFTAGQLQLIWARFRKNRSAMVGGDRSDILDRHGHIRAIPVAL